MALTKAQDKLLEALRKAAREMGSRGKALTSLIGELAACQRANLRWEPSDGYDATTTSGLRVQIKTRKSWTTERVNPSGRLGKYGRKAGYPFDTAMYVELDDQFNLAGIWLTGVDMVRKLEARESKGRALHVSTFIGNAEELELNS